MVLYKPKDMKDMESNGKGRLVRRFREAVDGPIIRRLYAKMPTSELAQRLGLTVRQIENYVYRHNLSSWARKLPAILSAMNSKKGKKGGRPRKET